ncbi:MAG: hypothetical protein ACXACA_07595 [Candidatus Ranarchaeia archaeon]|jgi:hypothetical protein
MKEISYSAVVLDEQSFNNLKKEFYPKIPKGWEWYGHHMTIKMGELPEELKTRIGERVELLVETLGADERAMALGVTGNISDTLNHGITTNPIAHITLAVPPRSQGGKPFHSNKIPKDNWRAVENRFKVIGTIQEVPKG